ncbi:hypothetical protein LCGC14_0427620 [marine sediment metagenome]|uniref:Phage virion morphogenesis protein n=1 Tax=marine sediment metagenome TaxID=412755 RepID=A0A0F9T771_9ZZZZ
MAQNLLDIKVFGTRDLEKTTEGFGKRLRKAEKPQLLQAGLLVGREAQKRIVGKRATNPPDLLGIVTGRLRSSLLPPKVSSDGLTVTVGTNVEYARKHEFGTKGSIARPFLLPALVKSESKIIELVGRGVSAALEG